jgi:hypothetical protein
MWFLKFISCILHKNNIDINTFKIQQIINKKNKKKQSLMEFIFKSLVCFRAINEHHKHSMINRPYTKIHVYIIKWITQNTILSEQFQNPVK